MEFDCLVSCERAGSADDGKYHKMSGDVMPTASIDRVEDIWYRAIDLGIPTVAIGVYFFSQSVTSTLSKIFIQHVLKLKLLMVSSFQVMAEMRWEWVLFMKKCFVLSLTGIKSLPLPQLCGSYPVVSLTGVVGPCNSD